MKLMHPLVKWGRGKTLHIYLIRHGESEGNKLNKIQGWQDFPLSPAGEKQAKLLGEHFKRIKLDHIYSSDLIRAYETAAAIGNVKNLSVTKWEALREIKLGPFEGKTKEEIYTEFPEAKEKTLLTSGVIGTEPVDEITKRCQKILETMQERHENESVAIVTHGGMISILLMYIVLGEDWHRYHRPFRVDNTGISLIEWKKGRKPLIHYTNHLHHLYVAEK